MEVVVTDGTSRLSLTFFGKHRGSLYNHEKRLVPGAKGLFTGTVGLYRGTRQLTHPDFTLMGEESDLDSDEALLEHATKPIPIYPAAAGIPSWKIQGALRVVLDTLTDADVPDPVPDEVRQRQGLPGRAAALRSLHRPATLEEAYRARHRMRFEEAFVLQAALAQRRARTAAEDATARPPLPAGQPSILADFDASLPFVLTDGQRQVGDEIAAELAQPRPMHRLLQGEVGSGKTVVALRAMLQVVDAGGQAALLAPTEVLAAQHARTLRALLGPLADGGTLFGAERTGASTRVALLTGSLGAKARKEALLQAASGEAGIVVGTHALLSEQVQFADLGLVVVDEQHRFGVEQRDALRAKGRVSPAPPGHDRHAHPAHRRDDGVRRPGDVVPHRGAGRARGHHHRRGPRGERPLDRPHLGPRPRGGRRRPPRLRRVRADPPGRGERPEERREDQGPGQGLRRRARVPRPRRPRRRRARRTARRCAPCSRWSRSCARGPELAGRRGRRPARPDAARPEGRRHGRLRLRRRRPCSSPPRWSRWASTSPRPPPW